MNDEEFNETHNELAAEEADRYQGDTLAQILGRQRFLQEEIYGYDYSTMSDEDKIVFIKEMVLACEDELHEALGETGWKLWATSKHINREAFVGELVDALHFFMNLCLVVDVTADELLTKYMAKSQKNVDRQKAGYDGVSTKCPGCKRAMDDDAVGCRPSKILTRYTFCQQRDRLVNNDGSTVEVVV